MREVWKKPEAFWLPGCFLLLLGLGNVLVGEMKVEQFQQVLNEFESTEMFREELASTPLMRLEKKRHSNVEKKRHFEERRNFYRIVSFGGKSVIGLSLILFLISAVLLFRDPHTKLRLARRIVRMQR
jgi:hypothetical protein